MNAHPTPALISGYAMGAANLDEATIWAVEAHLESCATCREQLTGAVDPGTRELLDRVADGIASGIATGPRPVRGRRLRRTGVVARFVPWLVGAVGLMLAAVAIEKTFENLPSLVLLIAPLAPLPPVAAVWSRRLDPAWELMVTVARSGMWLLLRRTLAVLAAVIPILAVAGWLTGHAPALWLLPCLAFTAGSLALGSLVGVDRASIGLTIAWSAGVVGPSLAGARLPFVLDTGSWPGWAAITAVLLSVLLIKAIGRRHSDVSRT